MQKPRLSVSLINNELPTHDYTDEYAACFYAIYRINGRVEFKPFKFISVAPCRL